MSRCYISPPNVLYIIDNKGQLSDIIDASEKEGEKNMGQRLVIHVERCVKGKYDSIATTYHHWSGFTKSALPMINKVIEVLDETKDVIKALKTTSAKTRHEEDCHRNDGILDTEASGIKESIEWAEQLCEIRVDEKNEIIWIRYEKLLWNSGVSSEAFDEYAKMSDEERNKLKFDKWQSDLGPKEYFKQLTEFILGLMKEDIYFCFITDELYMFVA